MLISMINTSGLVNNIQNRETCFEAGFMVSELSIRSLGFGESDVESDIQISGWSDS